MTKLTFARLREANVSLWVNGLRRPLDAYGMDDWIIFVGADVGRCLDVLRRMNAAAGTASPHGADLAERLAGSVLYLDLLLARFGTTFEKQGGYKSFVELRDAIFANNDGHGPSTLGRNALVNLALLATSGRAMPLLENLDELAMAFDIDLGAAVVAKFNRTSEKHGMPHRLQEAA